MDGIELGRCVPVSGNRRFPHRMRGRFHSARNIGYREAKIHRPQARRPNPDGNMAATGQRERFLTPHGLRPGLSEMARDSLSYRHEREKPCLGDAHPLPRRQCPRTSGHRWRGRQRHGQTARDTSLVATQQAHRADYGVGVGRRGRDRGAGDPGSRRPDSSRRHAMDRYRGAGRVRAPGARTGHVGTDAAALDHCGHVGTGRGDPGAPGCRGHRRNAAPAAGEPGTDGATAQCPAAVVRCRGRLGDDALAGGIGPACAAGADRERPHTIP